MSDLHNSEHQPDNAAGEPTALYGHDYTYGDYLHFTFDHMVELIRGKIFKMSPAPNLSHQSILGALFLQVGTHFRKLNCHAFIAPFDVVLPVQDRKRKDRNKTVVQPDLCVICDDQKLDNAGCFGAPDWIVEIISPHTAKKDLQLKYDVYEEAQVKEYWTIFPSDKLVEVFSLEEGTYRRIGIFTQEDTLVPCLFPDLQIDLKEVFAP